MKKILYLLLISLSITSCSTSKTFAIKEERKFNSEKRSLLNYAINSSLNSENTESLIKHSSFPTLVYLEGGQKIKFKNKIKRIFNKYEDFVEYQVLGRGFDVGNIIVESISNNQFEIQDGFFENSNSFFAVVYPISSGMPNEIFTLDQIISKMTNKINQLDYELILQNNITEIGKDLTIIKEELKKMKILTKEFESKINAIDTKVNQTKSIINENRKILNSAGSN